MTPVNALRVVLAALVAASPARAQAPERAAPRRGVERSVLPALNFDADEKLGYGAVVELYDYGDGTETPYRYTLQPTVFLTTAGRREVTVFFDAPHLLPGGWRLDAYAGLERQRAAPFYGVGNRTPYDERLDDEDGPNPYYYRYELQRLQASTNLQRRLGRLPLRALVGVGASRSDADDTPFDSGTTLLAGLGGEVGSLEGSSAHVRVGLVWDTRDREIAPRSGAWSEALVQRVGGVGRSGQAYTRWTLADRRYLTPTRLPVTLANRLVLQGVGAEAPFYDLPLIQSSFKQAEGLGGAKTLRGLQRNRYVGRGLFLWNTEVRWRAAEFRAPVLDRPSHAVVTLFLDQGRVWEDRVRVDELVRDLHRTVGGGLRLGLGESFAVAADLGWRDAGAPSVYVGLGYLF